VINTELKFNIYYQIADALAEWEQIIPNDVFWAEEFHKVIEKERPSGIMPIYCIIHTDGIATGIVYGQQKMVKLEDSIRLKKDTWYNKIIKSVVLPFLKQDTLVIGNLLLTGNYGMHILNQDQKSSFSILEKAILAIVSDLKKNKKIKVGPILIKDFFEEDVSQVNNIFQAAKFKVQQNMILDINPQWSKMDDYISALKAKARTRYNKARERLEGITSKELSLEELEEYAMHTQELYMNISINAGFNMFYLSKNYFHTLKQEMSLIVKNFGYFYCNKLVGFTTLIENETHIDAHFLGYNTEINLKSQLYLNMLLDMVNETIVLKKNKLILSRTAMEIKSSVGAKPFEMYCFLFHLNPILNYITPYVINYLYKEVKWEERNPFK
jgi:hypothetical protein